jgi:hypothetical protein
MKNIFRSYLYGYLNEYNNYKSFLDNRDNKSYKEFKIKKIVGYLKIPFGFINLFLKSIKLLSILEIPISLAIISYNFINYTLILLCTPKIKIQHAKLLLGLNSNKITFDTMMNSLDFTSENIIIIKIPNVSAKYSNYKKISIFSGLKFKDIAKAYVYAVKMVFFMKKKYHKRDFFFRSYSSFKYFVVYFFVTKSDKTNEYYFHSLIDRWSYLFGGIEHKTCFIQHGLINYQLKMRKIGKADYAYFIDKKQKDICEKILFKNIPVAYYRKPTNLDSTKKLLKNGFKNILMICNLLFFDKEKDIIENLKDKKVNLYVKPHPGDKNTHYTNLQLNNKFIILETRDYIKADIVISYVSTLATEYENNGILVLRHTDNSFQYDFDKTFELNN